MRWVTERWLLLLCCVVLASCGSVSVDDDATEKPVLGLRTRFFDRPVQAGIYQDRSEVSTFPCSI